MLSRQPSTINGSLNSYSHDEYNALIGSEDEIVLVAFRGKFLVDYKVRMDKTTNLFNANLHLVKKDSTHPEEELDVRASIPEARVLAKLYQIPSFGVNVPKEVNLNFARNLPTKPRLEYLTDKVGIKTVKEAYTAFAKYLDDDDTDIFFGKFGEKYDTETYNGFYAFNPKTQNMMFFREEKKVCLTNYMHIWD